MKERIEKLAETVAQVATFLKEEKTADAVATLEAMSTEVSALAEDVTKAEEAQTATQAELEQTRQDVEKKDAEIAKYANLNISADTLPKLFEELGAIKTTLSETASIVKASAENDEAVKTRLEAIEKAGASRQIQEEGRKEIAKCAGLDLSPRSK